jgi:hypothetical protein
MRSDSDIERDVKDELQWDPDLDATDIAVSVKSGVVTLAGYVKSYSDKYEAEVAAKRVAGVSGVANDLEIRVPTVDQRPDPDIARDAVAAIAMQWQQSRHICQSRRRISKWSSKTAGSRWRDKSSGSTSAKRRNVLCAESKVSWALAI